MSWRILQPKKGRWVVVVVDAHVHLGVDVIYDRHVDEGELLTALRSRGIDGCVVHPAHGNLGIEEERERHEVVASFLSRHRDMAVGVCAVNPHLGLRRYMSEVGRYIDLGFSAIAVHPLIHAWDPTSSHGRLPFEAARSFGVPLICHVGLGLPFGIPFKLFELCRAFPEVKVVLSHAGNYVFSQQCMILGKEMPNVYLETSKGPNMRVLKQYVRALGAERVMFGSDGLDEIDHALWVYRHAGLTDEELEWCLGRTAQSVFGGPEGRREEG